MRIFSAIKKRTYSLIMTVAILTVSSLSMSACKGLELENKTQQVDGYTESQAMIVLANERNRYKEAYTASILTASVGDGGESFEEVLTDNVREYLEQVRLLCMMADERGITVTGQERDLIRELSETYYSMLSGEDLSYIGCSVEDVQTVYEDLFQATKLINELTKEAQSEISDSEAKVIEIQQIGTSDLRKALAILKLCKIDGADFATMASRYTETDTVTLKLMRGTLGGLYEDTAFSLDEGEISNIIETGGMYYIIKCTDGYDEEATLERKSMLEDAINTSAFSEEYQSYKEEHNIRFAERFWRDVDLQNGELSTVDNFFELYEQKFPD